MANGRLHMDTESRTFFKFKKKLQIQIQMCVEVEVVTFMSWTWTLEPAPHTHTGSRHHNCHWFDLMINDQWFVTCGLWLEQLESVGMKIISWAIGRESWACSAHQLFSLVIALYMLWYGSLSHGMQRIGTLGVWTKAWSIVSFYESSTQLVSPGFLTIGHQHLVTVSRLFKFKFLQGTPGYG